MNSYQWFSREGKEKTQEINRNQRLSVEAEKNAVNEQLSAVLQGGQRNTLEMNRNQ